jgi:hypothetical protein
MDTADVSVLWEYCSLDRFLLYIGYRGAYLRRLTGEPRPNFVPIVYYRSLAIPSIPPYNHVTLRLTSLNAQSLNDEILAKYKRTGLFKGYWVGSTRGILLVLSKVLHAIQCS